MDKPRFVYVTYISTTPEKLWRALTDPQLSLQYWGHANVSDWQPGSTWEHRRGDGSGIADVVGRVVESDPPRRLVTTWAEPAAGHDALTHSRVTYELEPKGEAVRLTVTHEDLDPGKELRDVSFGWPAVLSSLKSFLETGSAIKGLW